MYQQTMMKKYKKKTEDFVATKHGWGKGIEQRFKAFKNLDHESNVYTPIIGDASMILETFWIWTVGFYIQKKMLKNINCSTNG